MEPLLPLIEATASGAALPAELRRLYGGDLSLRRPRVYANFVSSIDGVVALDPSSAPYVISGRSEADRFVMGLLRALADAVLIGAGTMRADRGHLWTPGYIYPPAEAAYAELRRQLGLSPQPVLVVVSASGDINPAEPGLTIPSLVVTGRQGAGRLRAGLPPSAELVELGSGREIEMPDVLAQLRARGLGMVLTEGGPRLLTQLLRDSLVDELFLTLSPVLVGRDRDDSTPRLGLVEGLRWPAGSLRWTQLLSARRHGSHLFLRYQLAEASASL